MIVVDIDGTIADHRHREHLLEPQLNVEICKRISCPYLSGNLEHTDEPSCMRAASCEHKKITQIQWDAFLDGKQLMKDGVIEYSSEVLGQIGLYHEIVFMTGRNENTRKATTLWLKDVFGYTDAINLFMRPANNREAAEVLKGNLLIQILLSRSATSNLYAFDDDEMTASVYRKHGFQWFHAPRCWDDIYKVMGLFQ